MRAIWATSGYVCMPVSTAVGFYQKLGYPYTANEFTEVTIPHYVMEKALCTASFDQPEIERIPVYLVFVGPHRCDNDQNQRYDSEDPQQDKADKNNAQDHSRSPTG